MSYSTNKLGRFIPFIGWLLVGGVCSFFLMGREWSQMQWEIPGTPSEYPLAQMLRPWLISIGCFLPAIVALIYAFAGIMDRYITRLFLSSFFLCSLILCLIFILGDFAENVGDYGEFQNPIMDTMRFYLLQLPMILNLILPYTLLLGVLWTLTKLSGFSEITGMLQSGRSLLRITLPIILCACGIAIYFGIFGFHWAPNSTLYRKLLFSSLSSSKNIDKNPDARACLYKNNVDGRIWRIGEPPGIDTPGTPLKRIRIEQFKSPGVLDYELYADSATWDHAKRTWTFIHAYKRHHVDKKDLNSIPYFDPTIQDSLTATYPETPWQLISPSFRADTQGTPQIQDLLASHATDGKMARALRTELHVRIARVFSCIILAFIAIPSSITFQRRSPMAGIGIAIFLAAALLFLYEFFPTLASAGFLPTWLGAWFPNIIYIGIAIYLFKKNLAMRTISECLKSRHPS
ncbi:MAG: LptF/LptG family permease [Akkermansia sp.]